MKHFPAHSEYCNETSTFKKAKKLHICQRFGKLNTFENQFQQLPSLGGKLLGFFCVCDVPNCTYPTKYVKI